MSSSQTLLDARREALAERFRRVRERTLGLAAPLSPEDCQVQSMEEASPVKWHLAHTTWFFETFVLRACPDFAPPEERFRELYNSYYETVARPPVRARRGLVTRPGLDAVLDWRGEIDAAVTARLDVSGRLDVAALARLELGLMHEEQHQELLLTDVKHALSFNPLDGTYRERAPAPGPEQPLSMRFEEFDGGLHEVGARADEGSFAYDNEGPRHRVWLEPFAFADRLVTNREYLRFIADDGYGKPRHWLSEGWDWVRREGIRSPLYWEGEDEVVVHTLGGRHALGLDEPVTHLSFFEADAYARWRGLRLPTESEWEVAARATRPDMSNDLDCGDLHPRPLRETPTGIAQLFGDAWEWTASPYVAYPGYRPAEGAIGEYNGKFMCNQMVLRGGSCVTPPGHVRASYRNFFPATARWQFSGLRLAKDLS